MKHQTRWVLSSGFLVGLVLGAVALGAVIGINLISASLGGTLDEMLPRILRFWQLEIAFVIGFGLLMAAASIVTMMQFQMSKRARDLMRDSVFRSFRRK